MGVQFLFTEAGLSVHKGVRIQKKVQVGKKNNNKNMDSHGKTRHLCTFLNHAIRPLV